MGDRPRNGSLELRVTSTSRRSNPDMLGYTPAKAVAPATIAPREMMTREIARSKRRPKAEKSACDMTKDLF